MSDHEYTNRLTGETRPIPNRPEDLEPWERAGLDDLANGATKHLPEDGSRWCRSNRYAVVYSALCGIYRLNKRKHPAPRDRVSRETPGPTSQKTQQNQQ